MQTRIEQLSGPCRTQEQHKREVVPMARTKEMEVRKSMEKNRRSNKEMDRSESKDEIKNERA